MLRRRRRLRRNVEKKEEKEAELESSSRPESMPELVSTDSDIPDSKAKRSKSLRKLFRTMRLMSEFN